MTGPRPRAALPTAKASGARIGRLAVSIKTTFPVSFRAGL